MGLPWLYLKLRRWRGLILSVSFLVAGAGAYFVRSRPLVFNESFWSHAHCIVGGGQSLSTYADTHRGEFPFHTNGYGDALVLVDEGWDSALTGPGYDTRVFERVRRTGEDAPEIEFGRVYVQGLRTTNSPEIVLLFDKIPTPGGDHCHGLSRLSQPLGREVWTIGSGHRFIPEAQWPAFAKSQVELLVEAAMTRAKAEAVYSTSTSSRR